MFPHKVFAESILVNQKTLIVIYTVSFQSVHQRLARSELQRCMTLKDEEYLQSCIDRCHKVKIDPHDDDLAAAHTKLEYLNHRKSKYIVYCKKKIELLIKNCKKTIFCIKT